jgi:hypothetical protein
MATDRSPGQSKPRLQKMALIGDGGVGKVWTFFAQTGRGHNFQGFGEDQPVDRPLQGWFSDGMHRPLRSCSDALSLSHMKYYIAGFPTVAVGNHPHR